MEPAIEIDEIRSAYTSAAAGSFTLGMVFNTFLVWLIVMKTPAPMLVYSKLLLAPCFMDIFIALCTFLIQPITVVDHGYFAIVQNGFFRSLPTPYDYTANVLWLQLLLLFVCCTTIQFVFRYYMISSDGKIPSKLKYTTGMVIIVLLIAHVFLHYVSDYPFVEKHPEMLQLAKLVEEEIGLRNIRFSSFTYARSPLWLFHCAVMVALFSTCYIIIAFCTAGTRRYITKTYSEMSVQDGTADRRKKGRMREYNQQVTTALLVQAILPTVDVLELVMQTCFPIFFPNVCTIKFMIFSAIPLYFIPVLNPLATMLLVKPYRRALLKIIGLLKGRVDNYWTSNMHSNNNANLHSTLNGTQEILNVSADRTKEKMKMQLEI